MGDFNNGTKYLGNRSLMRRPAQLWLCVLLVFLTLGVTIDDRSLALQENICTASENGDPESGVSPQRSQGERFGAVSEHGILFVQHTQEPSFDKQEVGEASPSHSETKLGGSGTVQGSAKGYEPQVLVAPAPGHEAGPLPAEGLGLGQAQHALPLPEISPIPGVTFVDTMIKLMEHELNGRTLGWRPNDIIFGPFTDDINSYQLGVLEALRFTTLRLKDSLTRMGDADRYDTDLEQALNLFMNRATLFWFPTAESSYEEALDHLRKFRDKLKNGQQNFYYRVDNLIALVNTYKDLMGNVNKNLVRPMNWRETDDNFFYAKGVAHVYFEMLRVVRVGYKNQLSSTLNALDIMDQIIHELSRAEQMSPWIILDANLDGLLANHRANLNAPLSEVVHLLGVMGHF
ncbi:MAG: DUF2333 family protein [Syntrophobacteraceae bacterium]